MRFWAKVVLQIVVSLVVAALLAHELLAWRKCEQGRIDCFPHGYDCKTGECL